MSRQPKSTTRRRTTRRATSRRYLMCRPTYFAVDYAINPWMDPSAPVDTDLAIGQWTTLRDTYLELGHRVDEIEPIPGLPDMVFAANGATVIDGVVMGSNFRYAERAAEAPAYLNWLDEAGFDTHEAKYVNEGEGDLLLTGRFLLAGTGFRTDHAAHAEAQELFGRPVITLQLVDPRYYHLDTALTLLGGDDSIAYLPEAFSESSQKVLRQLFPDAIVASGRRRRRARTQRRLRRPPRRAARPGQGPRRPARRAGLCARTGGPVRTAQGRRRPEVLHT